VPYWSTQIGGTLPRTPGRWRLAGLVAVLLTTAACAAGPAAEAESTHCADLATLALPGVTSASAELVTSGTAAEMTDLPEFCRVVLTIEPQVGSEVWLPTGTYNRRFQAVGGGGFAGVISYPAMATALRAGYATASTDTGHTSTAPQPTRDGSFALGPDGGLNEQVIEDFAVRSLIETTRTAKSLVHSFYGQAAERSYWNGCSTGGRQGLMLAQRHPDEYDGILAGAPAINWDRFIPSELWPQVVMQQELGGPIPECKLAAATEAAVAHCDGADGVADGVIDDPRRCDFDVTTLVGQATPCGEFTDADARVVQAIWNGPPGAWFGLSKGAPLNSLAGAAPFPIAENYHRFWVEQNAQWDWRSLDYAGFDENFRDSRTLFHDVIGTDDPDLAPFRQSGGHLLLWHGWNDELIFPQGTIDYYERVAEAVGSEQVSEFVRLYMAPGVEHCDSGPGPDTFDMLGELVRWVEEGTAPDRITASKLEDGRVVRTRPLCPHPAAAMYDGTGDPNSEASFTCAPRS
jgi:pimeloyl-ACP methyl ester carboxylesterase